MDVCNKYTECEKFDKAGRSNFRNISYNAGWSGDKVTLTRLLFYDYNL
jgi:hypothetical protein